MKGRFAFSGKGGEFFSLLLVQILLTFITLGIYYSWAIVKIDKFPWTEGVSLRVKDDRNVSPAITSSIVLGQACKIGVIMIQDMIIV